MLNSDVKLYPDMLYVKNLLQCYNIEYRDIDLSVKAEQRAIKTYDLSDIAFLRDLSELERVGEFKGFRLKMVCSSYITRKIMYRLRELLGQEVLYYPERDKVYIKSSAAERLRAL